MTNFRAVYSVAAVAFGILSLALAACAGSQTGGGLSLTPAVTSGSSVRLPTGDSVTILSRSLGSNVRLNVTKNPSEIVKAPNQAWSMLAGTLHAKIVPSLRETSELRTGLRLTFTYPAGDASQVRAGHASLLSIDYADGRTVRFVAPEHFLPRQRIVTVDVPATLLGGAVGVSMAIGVDNPRFKVEPPGPRFWNGTQWSPDGKIVGGKRTLVLVHGIFSSVEDAFPATPSPCPQQIANAGHYEQVLGWDYEWYYPPRIEGPLFFKFLNSIAKAGVTSVDVEAHSYGSLVSLSAIPDVDSSLKIGHVITLGGPLPKRGTPLAMKQNDWRMGFVLGFLDTFSDEPPSDVDKAINSGMIKSLQPNSPSLIGILDRINSMKNKPAFVEAAGTDWICLKEFAGVCVLKEDYFKKVLLDGSGVETPWDGVVETLAAESTDLPKPVHTSFPLSHIQLECHDSVIDWVAKQVAP
jgi:hypothetical protein